MLPPLNQTHAATNHVVVMGCGRFGASIATALAEKGHDLYVLDPNPTAFDLLPPAMINEGHIVPIVGDGTLEAGLRTAFTQDADIFIAVAGKDTRNALAAQIAKHILRVPTVICRMNDPTRNEMYSQLGLITISATRLVTEMVLEVTEG